MPSTIVAVYGPLQYSRDQAQVLLDAARRIVDFAMSLEKEVFGG